MKESLKLKWARRHCIIWGLTAFWLLWVGIDIQQEAKEMWGDNNTLAVIEGFAAFVAIFMALLLVPSISRRVKFFKELQKEEMEHEESQASLEWTRKTLKKFKSDFAFAICTTLLGIVVLPIAIVKESVLHIMFGVIFLILGIMGIIHMPKMVNKYKTLVKDKKQTMSSSL